MTTKKIAVVAGAAGIIGRAVINHLSQSKDWEIYGISRRKPDYESHQTHIAVDLLNRKEVQEKLKDLTNVTHIFFAAYIEKPTLAEQIPPNLAMLVNLVEVLETVSPGLVHVNLAEGSKWYGPHLGPIKTPYKEDDPRVLPPNFYYDQEDFLSSKVKAGSKWSWNGWRPNPVCGYAIGNPMNIVTSIAVYGSICKEIGIPMRFPGTEKSYYGLLEVCDSSLLAKAMEWAALNPEVGNKAFNISNGDVFRWAYVWPALCKQLGVDYDVGPPMNTKLTELMADKKPLWEKMIKKYGLRDTPYEQVTQWGFADWVFARNYDWFSDVNKLRRAGFNEQVIDTEKMFHKQFEDLRKLHVIPKLT